MMTEILVSQVGKEKAKELIEKATYSRFYKLGRELAKKAGNPQDIDGYIEAILIEQLGSMPEVPPVEIVERTKNRVIFAARDCFIAEAFAEVGEPEILEVAKYRCCHDRATANGFNPKMKFEMAKFLLNGDDCCEFVAELE